MTCWNNVLKPFSAFLSHQWVPIIELSLKDRLNKENSPMPENGLKTVSGRYFNKTSPWKILNFSNAYEGPVWGGELTGNKHIHIGEAELCTTCDATSIILKQHDAYEVANKASSKETIEKGITKTKFLQNQKINKTACIRAKPWMFRLPFKVYGAVITLKIKCNKTKWNFFSSKIWNFLWNLSPHTPYKVQKYRFRSL